MDRSENPHRLSAIDLLPEEATGDINWAINELEAGRRTDSDILFEFNDRLAVIGLGPVSKSAFGRYALKKRKIFSGRADYIKFAAAFDAEYGAARADQLTSAIRDMLQTAIWQAIMDGRTSPKDIASMSKAVQSLVNAQRTSTAERLKEKDRKAGDVKQAADKLYDAAEKALEQTGSKEGMDYIRQVREEIYGIIDTPQEAAGS